MYVYGDHVTLDNIDSHEIVSKHTEMDHATYKFEDTNDEHVRNEILFIINMKMQTNK